MIINRIYKTQYLTSL